ncbi:MAG: hypothetical protein ACFWT5_09220 [Pseudomonas helleri]|jgi:hypothetical protein|uniref:hypothetical protein n=1 Tax=Pseudomonas helleri TaxID=1608996 RepID=UPI003A101B2A
MAISIDAKYRGIAIPRAYVSIAPRSISLGKDEVFFCVMYRVDCNEEPFDSKSYTAPYSLDGENPFVQAYEYLKLQPEYLGYVDC